MIEGVNNRMVSSDGDGVEARSVDEGRGCFHPRPVCSIETARFLLGVEYDEERVMRLIESGNISWAFNIAMPKSGSRQVRISTRSLELYVASPGANPEALQLDWRTVIGLIVNPNAKSMTGVELGRVLNCGNTHVMNLIRAESFRLLRESWDRGPGNSPLIEAESVREWLQKRRVQ